MLKQSKNPEGYRNLLVYKKSEELLVETIRFTEKFPRQKTLHDLADQMSRSARSVKQNIVEGWKRNSTYEYYTFLGYSVASNAELLEDYRDICKGFYGAKGLKGVKGIKGEGEMGEKGGEEESYDLDALKFYPIDPTLPIPVQLYLRTKEVNLLIDSLQNSLLEKMKEEKTLGAALTVRLAETERSKKEDDNDKWLQGLVKETGLVMTVRGLVKKDKAEKEGWPIIS